MKTCKGCGAGIPPTGNAKYDREKTYCSNACNKRYLARKYHERRQKLMKLAECSPYRCSGCGGKVVTMVCRVCELREQSHEGQKVQA